MEIHFETATPRHRSEIDALLAGTYPVVLAADYPPNVLAWALPRMIRAQDRLLRCGTYLVARDGDGTVVGAGGWTRADPGRISRPAPGIAHVRHVVTDHRRLRQGIGRALMTHIAGTARDAGVARLACLSTLTARPFYAACGFAGDEPADLRLDGNVIFRVIRMQRLL